MGYKLIYFNFRGRAEIIRILFKIAGVEFEDHRIVFESWSAVKQQQQFTFGQIPVLEVDGVQLAQSHAIERFLATRFGLLGKNDIEAALIEGIAEEVVDVFTTYQKLKAAGETDKFFDENLPTVLSYFEKILSKNGKAFFYTDKISLAEVVVWYAVRDFFDRKDKVEQALIDKPKLVSLVNTVGELPALKDWVASRPVTPF